MLRCDMSYNLSISDYKSKIYKLGFFAVQKPEHQSLSYEMTVAT